MIPDIPQIRDSLAALTVKEVRSEVRNERQLTICEKLHRSHLGGPPQKDETAVVLAQVRDAPMGVSRVIEQIAKALHKEGHAHAIPRTDCGFGLASKVVGFSVALTTRLAANPLEALNLLFEHLSDAGVAQWAVLPSPSTGAAQYRFGDFTYGELDLNRLRSRCDWAGSDYFDRYGSRLRGRLSICRDSREIKVFDLGAIECPGESDLATDRMCARIIDDYFADIATAEQRVFMVDLDRQQAVFGAAGLGTIPAQSLVRLSALMQWITVLTRQEKCHGWVVPNQPLFVVSTPEPKALAEECSAITRLLALHDWQKRPLDPWIQDFCHYVTAAQDYERNGRNEEALLHLVYGLDFLLGGQSGEALTSVLAVRVALLSHRALVRPLKEVINFVRDCYDLRSGYVHRGEKGTLDETKSGLRLRERFNSLLQAARAVLGAACFARLQGWCQEEEARNAWIKRIDVLRAKHEAGIGIDDEIAVLGLGQVRLQEGQLPGVAIE